MALDRKSAMPTAISTNTTFDWFLANLSLLFKRPMRTQVAVLCHRQGENGTEVMLVTSRKSQKWIIPKGWPMAEYSERYTAKQEAFEEAGIVGEIGKEPLGEYFSKKNFGNGFKVPTQVIVYPLEYTFLEKTYPEKNQRQQIWLPIEEAVDKCGPKKLKKLLNSRAVKSYLSVEI